MLVLNPEVSEEQLAAIVQQVSEPITRSGGAVTKNETWGRRRLAYPIKHCLEGQYVVLQFNAAAALVKELDRSLKLNETVLRFLIVRLDE